MVQVSLPEAQARLADLIAAAVAGEEVVITRDSQTSVKLVPVEPPRPRPQFGSAKDKVGWMADDFDAPLEEFKDYMP
jgi:prevent-host-death family protein